MYDLPPPAPPSVMRCVDVAVAKYRNYGVTPLIMYSLLKTEGGQNGTVSKNKNGTVDLGMWQINSSWISRFKGGNEMRQRLTHDACYNADFAAWVASQELYTYNGGYSSEWWRRLGNYNSRTPRHNQVYQRRLYASMKYIYEKTSFRNIYGA